jgi:hypothetical protein
VRYGESTVSPPRAGVAAPRALLTVCLPRAGGGAFGIPATLRSPPADME